MVKGLIVVNLSVPLRPVERTEKCELKKHLEKPPTLLRFLRARRGTEKGQVWVFMFDFVEKKENENLVFVISAAGGCWAADILGKNIIRN